MSIAGRSNSATPADVHLEASIHPPGPSSRLPLLALVVLTIAAFARVNTCDFTNWDDPYTVSKDPGLNPPTASALARHWAHADMDIYMPMTQTVWAAVARFARLPEPDSSGIQLNPYPFHAFNLLCHVSSVMLVYSLLRLLITNRFAAWMGAAFFAVHPVMVEPVAWVSGLKDVLCGMWSLLALRLWIAPISTVDRPKSRRAMAALVYALALLSKPSAVSLPLVAGTLAVLTFRQPLREVVLRLLPWLPLAIPIAFIASRVQPAASAPHVALHLRPLIAIDAIAFYLHKLVWPGALGIDYGHTPSAVLAADHAKPLIAMLVLLCLGTLVVTVRRRMPLLSAGALVFILALLPVLGFVPFDFQQYSTVADHYLYLAMLGPALVVAAIWARWPWRTVNLAGLLIITILALRTVAQSYFWNDAISLMSHSVAVNPNSWVAHVNLGLAQTSSSPEDAIANLKTACHLRPQSNQAYTALGAAYLAAGQLDLAVDALNTSVALSSDDASAWAGLARALDATNHRAQAITAYRRALSLDRENPSILTDLAADLAESGQLSQAIDLYRRALALAPGFTPASAGLTRALADSQADGSHR